MNKTKIEWVKNPDGTQGYTWNPITGCLNGCEYCYARKLANGRLKPRYLANRNVAPFQFMKGDTLVRLDSLEVRQDPFYPRFWNNRLLDGRDELCTSKPRGMFVCDMSDLFGLGIPDEWTMRVLNVIKGKPQHRFYLLTKQPQNLIKWSPFPDNCWVGVTTTNPDMFARACNYLSDIQATVKYLSLEPFLEWDDDGFQQGRLEYSGVKLVIIGAQTKPYKPPRIEWVEEIVQICDKAGIPVFSKDNLRPIIPFTESNSWLFESIPGIPTGIKLRQEMPK